MRVFCLLICAALLSPVFAAPSATAVRAASPVTLDGSLADPAWEAAAWNGDFRSAADNSDNAGDPRPAAVQTRFKLLFDDTSLLVGVECDEPSPETLRATVTDHDGMVFTDDCVELFLDPGNEGRYYHHFVVNTKGAWYDDTGADYGLVHAKLWDCALQTAAQVDAAGKKWTAEVRIPFGALNFIGNPGPTWSWNMTRERYATGKTELTTWSPLKGNFHQPRLFGKVTGLDLDFRRFALALSEPKVSVSSDGSGIPYVATALRVKNETGADLTLSPTVQVFGKPETQVAAEAVSLAAGAEAEVAFPKLAIRGGSLEPSVEFRFADASGALLKSVVKQLNADYQPITITVLKPCYRSCIFASESLPDIEFRVALAEDIAPLAQTVNCVLASEDAALLWKDQIKPADLAATLKAPVADLPVGDYTILVEAVGADGKAIAQTRATVRKLPPPPVGNEVRIDELGNVLVNGKPWVGIGWYGNPDTTDPRKDVIALQNVQTPVVPMIPDTTAISTPFKEHGIYSFASVENGRFTYSFELWRQANHPVPEELKKLSEPSEEMRNLVRLFIESVRGEPGLVGYYISDEPEINNVRSDYLEAYYKLLCEEDPYHPVMVTNDTLDGIVTHGYKCSDILAPDPYSPDFDYVPNFMKRCREVMRPGQALMITPWHSSGQAHTTADYGTAPPYSYKVARNQYLVSLAFGSRAWMGYTSCFFMPEPELRFGLPHIWRELRFLESAMAAPAPAEPVRIEADAEMASWLRASDGYVYLVVVNHKPGARTATISHPLLKGIPSLTVVSEAREVAVMDGGFTGAFMDFFAEGDARIYTTAPARAFPTTAAIEADLAQRARDSARPGNLLHVSQGTRARASAGFYAPWFDQYYWYAINGITDDIGWQASHTPEDEPAWLELSLKEPKSIGCVVIYTPNLRDYDLQFQGPNGELSVAEVRGNTETVVEHTFRPAVPCLKLRITALNARDGKRQVSEIEAYEAPGDGPATPVTLKTAGATDVPWLLPAEDPAVANALWSDDFTSFQTRDKALYDGKDSEFWISAPDRHEAVAKPGGGVVCISLTDEGSGMARTVPCDPAHRFLQVNLSDILGEGYRFTNVGFSSSSGKPGFLGAINTNRPGIYTVDTHYIHDSFRTGETKDGYLTTYVCAVHATFDWMRLVSRPLDGLAVTLADGSPLPAELKQGDELVFNLLLTQPAADAVVEVMTNFTYTVLPLNGQPYLQLVRAGARDGREWAAKVKLGPGTGTFDQPKSGYPTVFRATVTGGAIKEAFASACISFR